MASSIQYKCPNCSGAVSYDAASGQLKCQYCGSVFNEADFKVSAPAVADAGDAVVYSCKNCGAQIVTSATTAATFCFYCHTPVVLSGRLGGDDSPDCVIPFKVTKQQALDTFKKLFDSKRFLPRVFRDHAQLDNISGVYFPYWYTYSDVSASLSARCTKTKVYRRGDYQITEEEIYDVERAGTLNVDAVSEVAITEGEKRALKYVRPFDDGEFQKFAMPYLSGFFAEKKNIERAQVEPQVNARIGVLAENALRGTVQGYSSVSPGGFSLSGKSTDWKYALLPVWMLTYRVKGEQYVYAVNGQNGKLYGMLPTDNARLRRITIAITVACAVLGALMGGMSLL